MNCIDAITAKYNIITLACIYFVIPGKTFNPVVTGTAVNMVIAIAAVNQVVIAFIKQVKTAWNNAFFCIYFNTSPITEQIIQACSGINYIGTFTSKNKVSSSPASQDISIYFTISRKCFRKQDFFLRFVVFQYIATGFTKNEVIAQAVRSNNLVNSKITHQNGVMPCTQRQFRRINYIISIPTINNYICRNSHRRYNLYSVIAFPCINAYSLFRSYRIFL